MTIAVHPGAVHHPTPGQAGCAADRPGDGRAHVRLANAAERDKLGAAAFHGRWLGYITVTYVAWWPDEGIFWERDGIPESNGGALIATFAEFPARLTRVVATALESIRSGVSSLSAGDTVPAPSTAAATGWTASESSDQMEHDLSDVSYISGGGFTVESTGGSFDGIMTDVSPDGGTDGTDGTDGITDGQM